MNNKGYYIVIEGPQGVGKSTQIKLLANALSLTGVPVKTFKEPDGSVNVTTQAISKITQDQNYPLNSKAEVLLYNASRAISLDTIFKYKNKGFVCIVDRSYLSTLAVQYYGDNTSLDYNSIVNILNFSVGNNQPDYMLILDAPAQYLHQRQQKLNGHERFDSLELAKLDKIRAGYLIEAKKRNISVIVATESPIAVHGKIWQHIYKVLSNNYTKQTHLLTQSSTTHTNNYNYKTVITDNIMVNNVQVSELLLPKIAKLIDYKVNNNSKEINYVVPSGLPTELKNKYIDVIKKIAKYNLQINNKINNINLNDAQSLAAINNLSLNGTPKEYSKVLKMLLLVNSQESLKIFTKLQSNLKNYNNKYFNTTFFASLEDSVNIINKSNKQIKYQTQKILSESYSSSLDLIQLTSCIPKNELTLLNYIIYNKSDISSQEINNQLLKTSYINKANLLSSFINSNDICDLPAIYTWEIITSYANYVKFAKLDYANIKSQIISPRYGYNIPKQIEKVNALDEYLECFDASLELHSMLIMAKVSEEEAQYACLKGHKIRVLMQTNINQTVNIIKVFNKSKDTDLLNISKNMIQIIAETHPITSEAISLD